MHSIGLCIDKRFIRKEAVDERIFGAFVEHMNNTIYHGLYAPGHPLANQDGFRQDVIDLVRTLRLPLIRYPGGNFICTYRWEDTVGPVAERPVRADLAWRQLEPNRVGLSEFTRWVEAVGSRLALTVNLSTRGAVEAANLVEYCNHPGGTYWSDLRRRHGDEAPFDIRLWFLGNEVDGPWNIGRKRAEQYAWDAVEAAKAMRRIDSGIELVAVGSSGTQLDTYLSWDQTVLEEVYDCCEYLSLHRYAALPDTDAPDSYDCADTGAYLALAGRLDRNIQDVRAVCDYVRGKKRSGKTMYLSVDEYNALDAGLEVAQPEISPWQLGPSIHTPGLTMRGTLLFALYMLTLLRHADRVKIACQSILINGAGLVICEEGQEAWVNGSYYVFLHCSLYGRGRILDAAWRGPGNPSSLADSVCVYHEHVRELVVFAVNKGGETLDFHVETACFGPLLLLEHLELANADPYARNSADCKDALKPVARQDVTITDQGIRCELTGYSWNVIRLKER